MPSRTSIRSNLGTCMLARGQKSSFTDLVTKVKQSGCVLDRIVVKIDDPKNAQAAFQFNNQHGKKQFYPLNISRNSKQYSMSHLAVAAKALGMHKVNPVTLLNLSPGQYHLRKDGIKKTG